MTDKELARKVFPPAVRKQLKKLVLELDREKPRGRKRKKA
jgi:hypothetical protein